MDMTEVNLSVWILDDTNEYVTGTIVGIVQAITNNNSLASVGYKDVITKEPKRVLKFKATPRKYGRIRRMLNERYPGRCSFM